MKQLVVVAYRYREHLAEDDLRHLTKRFLEWGDGPEPIAHYERLDGRGGFLVRAIDQEPVKVYETMLRYAPYLEFELFPVTTIDEAMPVISTLYG